MKTIIEKLEDFMTPSIFEPKPNVSFVTDEELFNRMADFITELNPDTLTDDQLITIMDIIENLEIETDEEIEEAKMAKKTLASKKTYGRLYYHKNKLKVQKQKKKIQKSVEGRKRERARERMKSGNKTPTGRTLKKYHTDDHTN
jgi:hypothetical protein